MFVDVLFVDISLLHLLNRVLNLKTIETWRRLKRHPRETHWRWLYHRLLLLVVLLRHNFRLLEIHLIFLLHVILVEHLELVLHVFERVDLINDFFVALGLVLLLGSLV